MWINDKNLHLNVDIYSIARVISNDNLYYFVCWYLLVVDHSYGGNFWIEISAVKNKGRKTDLKIPALWLVNIQLKKNKEIAVCFYSSDSCSILSCTGKCFITPEKYHQIHLFLFI